MKNSKKQYSPIPVYRPELKPKGKQYVWQHGKKLFVWDIDDYFKACEGTRRERIDRERN